MPTTSLTLLDRLRRPDQADAWNRFARLYAPLLVHWAQLQGFHEADAEDLAQTVLIKLIRLLPGYERRPGHTFRGWLFTICRNECRDFRTRRATCPLPGSDGLSTAAPSPADDPEEAEYRRFLVHRALELVRTDFSPAAWEAFTRFVLDGTPAPDVARAMGQPRTPSTWLATASSRGCARNSPGCSTDGESASFSRFRERMLGPVSFVVWRFSFHVRNG